MSVITDIWRQLVRRRLWPVALLLLGALVAVPVLLAKSPAPVPPPAPAADAGSPSDGLAEPVVSLAATDPGTNGRRHLVGARKDPFKPAPVPKPKHTASTSSQSAPAPAGSGSSVSSGSGGHGSAVTPPISSGGGTSTPTAPSGSSGGGGGGSTTTPPTSNTPATPPASAPPAKKKSFPLYSLKVRFGDANADQLPTMRVNRGDPLPDADTPMAIYLGPGPDKRSATFLVDGTVEPQGDGTCKPYAADCEQVVLHQGETEFFDVKDATGTVTATYELDLLDIVTKSDASAHRARAARRAVRHALRSDGGAGVARAAGQMARVVAVLEPSL
jgi:hypothetical protein